MGIAGLSAILRAMRLFLIAAFCFSLACPGESAPLVRVDLRTDLVPGVELAEVVVTLTRDGASQLARYRPIPSDDAERGIRVAEFPDLSGGEHDLEVQLLRADGSRLGVRRRAVRVVGDTGVTVVFGRNCVEVSCPDGADASATECLNGRCVPPECTADDPAACGDVTCQNDGECPAPAAACALAACVDGECLDFHVAGSCAPSEVCLPDTGCMEVMFDAGGGSDGGADAEVAVDAGMDDAGGTDAGAMDAGTDAGPECMGDGECDDGVYCNGAERCIEGSCADAERAIECDDGISCTRDSCDEAADDCAFVPDDGLCTAMAGGTCEVPGDCQYPSCTAATCMPGPCQSAECVGDRCERTDLCGAGTFCCAGSCAPLGCDDGNPCTDDSCGGSGCVNTANTDPCSDGDGCTVGDACAGGSCRSGSPMVCNDGNGCTDDACVSGSCRFTDHTRTCDDGNACTSGDRCGGGSCNPGSPVVCNDGNPCTDDRCEPASGCETSPTAMGTMCGVDQCGPWDSCTGFGCGPGDGNQFRSCRPRECNGSGSCVLGSSEMESRSCTPDEGSSCAACGGTGCGGPPTICDGLCNAGCCTEML